jgi:hypothetical protein
MAAYPSAHPTENQHLRSVPEIILHQSQNLRASHTICRVVEDPRIESSEWYPDRLDRLHDSTNLLGNLPQPPRERTLCGAGPIVKRPTSRDVPIEFEHFCGVPAHR